jgi:hypothetical protein
MRQHSTIVDDQASAPWSLEELGFLRIHHPAWRLLAADHAPFIIAFLHRTFLAHQRRQIPEGDLLNHLEDHLHAARTVAGEDAYRRTAAEYLSDWSSDGGAWVRASYPPGQDEPVYDLTAAAERAIEWLGGLGNRPFVGTESRLLTVIDLLRQIRDGTEQDAGQRVRELEQRRAAIDQEIARARSGQLPLMTDVAIRDRFQLVVSTARALLADLRDVEQNFRQLDRDARTRIAQWESGKGSLLSEILAHRDDIAQSDQGRSFRAFWEFLMSPRRQQEFDTLLEVVLALPAVATMAADPRLARMRFDWLGAGEHAQRTVARLSEQLRRFLDDRAAAENRRITELIRTVERHASRLRERPPAGEIMAIDELAPEFTLPFNRPLYTPPLTVRFSDAPVEIGLSDADTSALFDQVYIDPALLAGNVRRCLADAAEAPLTLVLARHPLEQGLAELVGYLRLASDEGGLVRATIDEGARDPVAWTDPGGRARQATLPRIVFAR